MRLVVCSPSALADGDAISGQVRLLVARLATSHDVTVLAPTAAPARAATTSGDLGGARRIEVTAPAPPRAATRAVAVVRRRPVDWHRRVRPFAAELALLLSDRDPHAVVVMGDELVGLGPLLAAWPTVVVPMDHRPLNVAAQAHRAGSLERCWRRQQAKAIERALGGLTRFDVAAYVTEPDAAAARAAIPGLRTATVPIAVAVPSPSEPADAAGPRAMDLLLFTGDLGTPANATAAERLVRGVLPRVREGCADAHVAIVGRRPGPEVRALAETPGVEVVVDVPDLDPWLRRASVLVAPMATGTGMKTKLLEAMVHGTPCVTTPLGAQGLDAAARAGVLVAEDDAGIAAHVIACLTDPAAATALGKAGARVACSRYSPEAVAARYEAVITRVVEDRSG